jgi:FAD:protein FMN transferase
MTAMPIRQPEPIGSEIVRDPARHRSVPVKRTAPVMGTVASIHVFDALPDTVIDRAIDRLFVELERLEAMFSTFRPASEISRVNRRELHPLDCSPEVIEVLDACTMLEHLSDGAFTAHPPDRPDFLDPAGFVKGWATERSTSALVEAGLRNWYVNVGGDIQTCGSPAPGAPWRVAIADPNHPGEVVTVLDIDGGAVATSGVAERGRHIWRRPASALSIVSMTVAGQHLTWADAYATAAFAIGDGGVEWIRQRDGYEAFAVFADGSVATTL